MSTPGGGLRRPAAPDDRAARERGRAGVVLAVMAGGLAGCAAAVVVLSDDARWLRLAVVAALWAALLAGAFLVRRGAGSVSAANVEADRMREAFASELEDEVEARREFEESLERDLRSRLARELEERHSDEVAGLRAELERLQARMDARADAAAGRADRAAEYAVPTSTFPEAWAPPPGPVPVARAPGAEAPRHTRTVVPVVAAVPPPPSPVPPPVRPAAPRGAPAGPSTRHRAPHHHVGPPASAPPVGSPHGGSRQESSHPPLSPNGSSYPGAQNGSSYPGAQNGSSYPGAQNGPSHAAVPGGAPAPRVPRPPPLDSRSYVDQYIRSAGYDAPHPADGPGSRDAQGPPPPRNGFGRPDTGPLAARHPAPASDRPGPPPATPVAKNGHDRPDGIGEEPRTVAQLLAAHAASTTAGPDGPRRFAR